MGIAQRRNYVAKDGPMQIALCIPSDLRTRENGHETKPTNLRLRKLEKEQMEEGRGGGGVGVLKDRSM